MTHTNNHIPTSHKCRYFLLGNVFMFLIGIIFIFGIINNIIDIKVVNNETNENSKISKTSVTNNRRRLAPSYSWDGKADIGDLSDGDIVVIRHYFSGYLKNPSSTNKVKLVNFYADNRMLEQIFQY